MVIWDRFVELLVAALFALAQAYGGNLGLAIITLSLSVRLALLPLTLRMARRAQERQTKFRALEPMVYKLQAKYRSDPKRLQAELIKLYRQHGYSTRDTGNVVSGFLQIPFGFAVYTAIKRGLVKGGHFLWISNLARPDTILALLIGILTYFVAILSPGLPQQTRFVAAIIPALLAVYVAWNLASGVGLYWATSATVDVLQLVLLRRNSR